MTHRHHWEEKCIICYVGGAVVLNSGSDKIRLVNFILEDCSSYDEAVGRAYLDVKRKYTERKGWVLVTLAIENIPVWIERDNWRAIGETTIT